MYNFNDLNPRSKPFDAPVGVEAVTYNGHKLDTEIAGFQTLTVEGREDFSRKINSVDSSGDGTLYLSSKLDERELVVNFYLETETIADFNSAMTKLKNILREPNKKIVFADDTAHYYIGTPKLEVAAGTLTPTGKITFTLNDPFLYSELKTVSSKSSSVQINDNDLIFKVLPKQITVTMGASVGNFTMTNGNEKFTTTSGVDSGNEVSIDFDNLTYVVSRKDETGNVSLQSNFGDFYIKNGDTISVPSANRIIVEYYVKTL